MNLKKLIILTALAASTQTYVSPAGPGSCAAKQRPGSSSTSLNEGSEQSPGASLAIYLNQTDYLNTPYIATIVDHILRFIQTVTIDSTSAQTLRSWNGVNAMFRSIMILDAAEKIELNKLGYRLPAAFNIMSDVAMVQHAGALSKLQTSYGKGKKFMLVLVGLAALASHVAANKYSVNSEANDGRLFKAKAMSFVLNWIHLYMLRSAQSNRLEQIVSAPQPTNHQENNLENENESPVSVISNDNDDYEDDDLLI